jgi:type I restriction enzyme S subunit
MIEDLKPYPQYKDSGLPWLGQVPAHWEIARSKRLFRQRKEFANPEDQQLSATQAYGVISQALYEKRTGYRVVKISMHLDKRKHVEAGDFVISMRSFQGGLERAWEAGAIRSSYVVLKPSAEVSAGYFQHLFKSNQYINALRATSDFIRDGQDLNFGNF